jgi:hypothetical protein
MANNLKGYDANQVLRSVFDVEKNTLRISIVDGSSGGGEFEVVISHINDSIRLGNGTTFFTSSAVAAKTGLDTAVINEVNIEDLDASKDNVAVQDADGDELEINTDGSINIQSILNPNSTGLKKYSEITAIAAGLETTIVSHTALPGRRTFLQKVITSGDNIAKYRVKINGTTIDLQRTYFGAELNALFEFEGDMNPGLEILSGDQVTVTVFHNRTMVGDFNAKIQYLEVI